MKIKFFLLATVLAITGIQVNAQAVKREVEQHRRIKQGVRSGELTPSEARNLRRDQKAIHQEVKAAKADGVVTPEEKKDIRQDQNRESRKIYRKKHNARVR